jgi:hypothetical protein
MHYFLHLIFPAVIAYKFYPEQKLRVYLILLATMVIDLDHLLASDIYSPCRCSIGFHPLHSWLALIVYVSILFVPRLRVIGIGLVLHFLTDLADCFMMGIG